MIKLLILLLNLINKLVFKPSNLIFFFTMDLKLIYVKVVLI
jgi:hypothetical protein